MTEDERSALAHRPVQESLVPPRHARASGSVPRGKSRIFLVLAMCAALVCAWIVWLAVDGLHARDELQSAADLVSTLQEEALAGDQEAAATTLGQLQEHARTARADLHGPHWSLAAAVPRLGDNVTAVQVVSEVVDDLAHETLPSLVEVLRQVDPASFTLVGGRIDLGPVTAAAPAVIGADASVRAQEARLAALASERLLAQVSAPVADFSDKLADLSSMTGTAAKAVSLLPAMLGADGPRDYLLLVQTTAEPRATGGIPGSVLLLRADDGAVSIVEQRSGGELGNLAAPVLPLTPDETSLFGDDLAADMRDVTFTPDFPRSAQIAAAIWTQEIGGTIDGVLSMDPGTLALVLGATGPLALPAGPVADATGGMLTTENAAQVLLNTVYLALDDPNEQDDFFNLTAGLVFAAAVSGQGDPGALVDTLAEAARQGRLMVWSAQPDEESKLEGTVLSGELVGAEGDSPVIGVYYNDGSAAKMGYYLRSEIDVQNDVCLGETRQVTIDVTLTNTAPADAAGLPPYLTGSGIVVPPGDVRTNVLFYAPEGGLIDEVRLSSGTPGFASKVHDGLAVAVVTTQLAPGESITLSYDVTTGSLAGPVVVRSTPLHDGRVKSSNPPPQCAGGALSLENTSVGLDGARS